MVQTELLVSLRDESPRGRQLLRMVQQLSNAARLVPFSASSVLILLTLDSVHVALCCEIATALCVHGKKNGAVASCHTSCAWLCRSVPWDSSCEIPLTCRWPELPRGHSVP